MIRQSDIDAIAKAIDPTCFMPEFIIIDNVSLEFRQHMLARRKSARRIARIAIETLDKRNLYNRLRY